jgi:hypothetical protein
LNFAAKLTLAAQTLSGLQKKLVEELVHQRFDAFALGGTEIVEHSKAGAKKGGALLA